MMVNNLKRQFKVIIERDEDGYLIASMPALPGCHTQAKTFAELTNIKDAVKLCLKAAKTNSDYQTKIDIFGYEPSSMGMDIVTL